MQLNEIPYDQMDLIPRDWVLRCNGKEWRFHRFWIRVHSGLIRDIPERILGHELDITDTFPDMDDRALDSYEKAIYGAQVQWTSEKQVVDFHRLVDYMDSTHLNNAMCRYAMVSGLDKSLTMKQKVQFANEHAFPELLEKCASQIYSRLNTLTCDAIKEILRKLSKVSNDDSNPDAKVGLDLLTFYDSLPVRPKAMHDTYWYTAHSADGDPWGI